MDGAGRRPDKPESLPPSSLINKLSGVFGRDWSASPDRQDQARTALLTSFRTLSKEEAAVEVCKQSSMDGNTEAELKDCEDEGTGMEMSTIEPNNCDKSVDTDLLLVTMVETYSDDGEEEDIHTALARSGELSQTPEMLLSEAKGSKKMDRPKEPRPYSSLDCRYIEQHVDYPVFRTHNLMGRSPSTLVKTRFARSNSKTGPDEAHSGPQGNATTEAPLTMETAVCEPVDTCVPADATISSSSVVESMQASPITVVGQPEKNQDFDQLKEMSRQDTDGKGGEESHSSPVSSPLPLYSPRITEFAPCPEAETDTNDMTEDLSGSFCSIEASTASSATSQVTRDPIRTSVRSPNSSTPLTSSPKRPSSLHPASANSSPSKGAATSPAAGSFQLPALFSGLRVLKKGATGEDRGTLSEIKQRQKDMDLAMLSLKKTVNKAKNFPEQITVTPVKKRAEPKPVADTKCNLIGQLNLLLNLDNHEMSSRSDREEESSLPEATKDAPKVEEEKEGGLTELNVAAIVNTSLTEKKTTSDLAYETFRRLLGPKTPKKEINETMDLDAVKKKLKNDKDLLKSIFDRSAKSPGSPTDSRVLPSPTEANAEVTSPTDSEDRTPGRLQAVWPPPKPKDEEDKVGLKYTEAGKNIPHPGSSSSQICWPVFIYTLYLLRLTHLL